MCCVSVALLDLNIAWNAWIDLVVVGELATEPHDARPLTSLQPPHLEAGSGVAEDLRRARAVVDKDAVAEGQIILHRVSDRAGDLEQPTLGRLAEGARRGGRRAHWA